MRDILVFGASGHAKVVLDVIEKEENFRVKGLIDPNKEIGEDVFGYKIIGKEEDISKLYKSESIYGGIIAIGDNWVRKSVHEKIIGIIPDFNFISCIHPSVEIGKEVKIGVGAMILPGAIINADTQIGDHCILNTNSSLDHDSLMGNFSSLAPNATTGSNVIIGECSAISLGANVIQNIKIGNHCVIGAGSVVIQDIADNSLSYGVPAEVVKKREKGESYL